MPWALTSLFCRHAEPAHKTLQRTNYSHSWEAVMGAGRRGQKNTIVLTPTIVFLGFSSVTQRQMSNRSIRTQHSFPTQTGLTARKHDRATFEPSGRRHRQSQSLSLLTPRREGQQLGLAPRTRYGTRWRSGSPARLKARSPSFRSR